MGVRVDRTHWAKSSFCVSGTQSSGKRTLKPNQ